VVDALDALVDGTVDRLEVSKLDRIGIEASVARSGFLGCHNGSAV